MRITIWGVRLMTLYLLNAIDKRSRISRGNAEEQPIMNVHTSSETPPPPSPTASEPPPSYDSLTPTTRRLPSQSHPAPQSPRIQENPSPELPRLTDANATTRTDEVNGSPQEVGDNLGNDPPPPYSPGLRNTLGIATNQQEGTISEAPPSYYSLFGQIQEARQQSSNNFAFLKRVGQIIMNTVCCTILLVAFMSIPIAVVVLGAIFVHQCPLQPLIPIFLMVGGSSGILKNFCLITESIAKRRSASLSRRVQHPQRWVWTWRAYNLVFNFFMLGWVLAGSYWVYSNYREVVTTNYATCNELLYKFSFSIVTATHILLLLVICCVFCMTGLYVSLRKQRRSPSHRTGSNNGSASDEGEERSDSGDLGSAGAQNMEVVEVSGLEVRVDDEQQRIDGAEVEEEGHESLIGSGIGVMATIQEQDEDIAMAANGYTEPPELLHSFPPGGTRRLLHDPRTGNPYPHNVLPLREVESSPSFNRRGMYYPEGQSSTASNEMFPLHEETERSLYPSRYTMEDQTNSFSFTSSSDVGLSYNQSSKDKSSKDRRSTLPHYTNTQSLNSRLRPERILNRPHSIPSLFESHSYDLNPRHMRQFHGGSGYRLSVNSYKEDDAARSLYNTIRSNGFSLTAV